jgi:hypothetical protein
MPPSGTGPRRRSATGAEGVGPAAGRLLVAIAAALALACAALAGTERVPSRCDARARTLFGDRAVLVTADPSDDLAPPTLAHRAPFDLPELWPPACKSSMLAHELLLDDHGQVREVFTLRSPCAEFDRAVRRSLRRWTYQPARRAGASVATCITVSTIVHPR